LIPTPKRRQGARSKVRPAAETHPQQIGQARKLIAQGERPEDVVESFHVGRSTLYRALAA
jgi:DNA invertase Pin-like site-specific DNA recombinase